MTIGRQMPGADDDQSDDDQPQAAGIDLAVSRKGRGPSILVLHGGGGRVLGYPFADRLVESIGTVN
jgi:hypothetical protein